MTPISLILSIFRHCEPQTCQGIVIQLGIHTTDVQLMFNHWFFWIPTGYLACVCHVIPLCSQWITEVHGKSFHILSRKTRLQTETSTQATPWFHQRQIGRFATSHNICHITWLKHETRFIRALFPHGICSDEGHMIEFIDSGTGSAY